MLGAPSCIRVNQAVTIDHWQLAMLIYYPRPTSQQFVRLKDIETGLFQWEFQDPKMEVLYHIGPYFARIFPYIGLI